jgi:uncharacterized protein YceH (UPF0502 family)
MDIILTSVEARVLGVLIEKEMTTPAYYPLSLNALTVGCNQKSNRNPVMELDMKTSLRALDRMRQKKLVTQQQMAGSRVLKYSHNLKHLFNFTPVEAAILCELLIRGPQTPGELRARAARMHPFADIAEVTAALAKLGTREDGPFVTQLPRQPGRREERYAHLFCGKPENDPATNTPLQVETLEVKAEEERLNILERKIEDIQRELNRIKSRLGAPG